MDKLLQSLVDAPLANALKLNLVEVEGQPKKRAVRKKTINLFDAPAPILKRASEYREQNANAKPKALFDYYATTSVPFERIAEHMKVSVEQVRESMSFRGRME